MSSLFEFHLSYTFSSDRLEELNRQISLLLSTREGTMPLDREFGINMDFLDLPTETVKNMYVAEISEKITKFIPQVRVESVSWTENFSGLLSPKVVITNGGN